MLSNSNNAGGMQRFLQISESHCGAAVLQMLLSNLGVLVSQDEIAAAAGATHTVEEYGLRVDQLILATQRLAPQAQFWYKNEANLTDLNTLVNQYGCPVGVEWQGVFGQDEEEEEEGEEDYGHYSIVTKLDLDYDTVVLVDPYRDFGLKDRYFNVGEFLERWWDVNEVFDQTDKYSRLVEDYHLLFIVVPRGAAFPKLLDLRHTWDG